MNIQRTSPLVRQAVSLFRRNLASTSALANKQMDPIQKLYLDQVVSYGQMSKKQGGGPVDAGADYQKMKDDSITRLQKVYQVGDPKQFPNIKFTEPNLDQDAVE
ncbi:ATP synthase peripheral stalk subunit F6, mitochondrial-like [Styela clava]